VTLKDARCVALTVRAWLAETEDVFGDANTGEWRPEAARATRQEL
jgi:hypothetical protein